MTNIISSMDKKITAVIPTYNRCPFAGKDTRFNPLWWAANSLFQETQVGEIIFIDDCSSDNIEETIAKIDESKPSGTSVVYARNEERKGSGISRNLGVNLASNEQIFFYDDGHTELRRWTAEEFINDMAEEIVEAIKEAAPRLA